MQVISRPRRCGKTWESAQWVKADSDRVLLTMDAGEADRLRREYGIPARQVMPANPTLSGHRLYGRANLAIGVDNIDILDWRTLLKLGRFENYIELATETRGF